MNKLTAYEPTVKNYLLSDGTSTTDFWEWHQDSMKTFHKQYSEKLSTTSTSLSKTQSTFSSMQQSTDSTGHDSRIKTLRKKASLTTSSEQEINPKLLVTMKKLETFAEQRKKTNYMAMNFYSYAKCLYKPLTESDLGGEWETAEQLRTHCQNHIARYLAAQGYAFTNDNFITFAERYMTEFPKLHLDR